MVKRYKLARTAGDEAVAVLLQAVSHRLGVPQHLQQIHRTSAMLVSRWNFNANSHSL
jgi:hypothetical protein